MTTSQATKKAYLLRLPPADAPQLVQRTETRMVLSDLARHRDVSDSTQNREFNTGSNGSAMRAQSQVRERYALQLQSGPP